MLVKVCGLTEPENIVNTDNLGTDFVGLIFYDKSPRYVSGYYPATFAKRVGVFVNASTDYILDRAEKYKLDYIQFHGEESPDICREIGDHGLGIIKVFSVGNDYDFSNCDVYSDVCDFFLFDTKCAEHGGSGRKFDWSVLERYRGKRHFLLSGGINSDDADEIIQLKHPQLAGVDLNSGFEIKPGIKDTVALQCFMEKLNKRK